MTDSVDPCSYCNGSGSRIYLGNYISLCPNCGKSLERSHIYSIKEVAIFIRNMLKRRTYLGDLLKHSSMSNIITDIDFIEAASEGNEDTVRAFILQNGNVNCVNPINGMTALHYAAGHNALEVIDILLSHAHIDPLIKDSRGRLPSDLAFAIARNDRLGDRLIEFEAATKHRGQPGGRPAEPVV